ncbi:MAG: helix-turn-helix transcriptional regulator, partial [Nitrososphaerales archaeon]
YIRRSGRSVRHASVNLRPEEEEVLRFIREQGGMVLESELRKKFILPKTSMWRMAKRLERAGLVKINRVGLQNEIELVRR